MTDEGIERFSGLMNGFFMIRGSGDLGVSFHFMVPFELTMKLEKSKTGFSGTYDFAADPVMLAPTAGVGPSPSVFGIFPHGSCFIPDPNYTMVGATITVSPVRKQGPLEVTYFGSGRIRIKFPGIPEKFDVLATALWRRVLPGVPPQVNIMPGVGAHQFDLGFFSKAAPNSLQEITLDFNAEVLAFHRTYKDQARMSYPNNGTMTLRADATVAKTESCYFVIEDGRKYVGQVTEVEEARKLFLEHPELYAQIRMMGDAETRRGVKEKLIDGKHANMFADGQDAKVGPAPPTRTEIPEAPLDKKGASKPLEGLIYGIEQLIAQGQDGYNGCMLVVDGCWVSVEYKSKNKQLYIQVAGDKYIPKKSRLGSEHIKILETMGITKEQGSDDLFSAYFAVGTTDTPKLSQDVFRVFDEALRVSKGSKAYLQLSLVNKPTPEYEAVLTKMATIIQDRREKKKFFWNW